MAPPHLLFHMRREVRSLHKLLMDMLLNQPEFDYLIYRLMKPYSFVEPLFTSFLISIILFIPHLLRSLESLDVPLPYG